MTLDLARIPLAEVYKHFESDANGLTEQEASRRLSESRKQRVGRSPALMRVRVLATYAALSSQFTTSWLDSC